MKPLITFFLLLMATSIISIQATPPPPIITKAGKVSLQWTASPTPSVTYKLYHSTNNVTWDKTYPGIPTLTYTVTNVPAGSLNWFAVTAVNLDGIESDPSNVIEKPIESKPAPATGLMSVPVVVSVESSMNSGASWSMFRNYTNNVIASTNEPEMIFRSTVSIGRPTELVSPR